jgi:hypothetical protein
LRLGCSDRRRHPQFSLNRFFSLGLPVQPYKQQPQQQAMDQQGEQDGATTPVSRSHRQAPMRAVIVKR